LKGRRDRIPALRRKGRSGGERLKKYLIFYLEKKTGNIIFVVPKAKRKPPDSMQRRRNVL
jgi:hypothetical protein